MALQAPSTPSAPPVLLGRTTPRVWTQPLVTGEPGPCGCGCALTPATSLGFEADDFARDVLGLELIPWQRWLLIHGLELRPDGGYRFRTVVVLVARQQGKTTGLMVLSLWRMLMDGADLVLGTSTNLDYAKESWLKAVHAVENSDILGPEFTKPRFANGEQSLGTVGGARYKIAAANRKGGRSLSVDLLVLDELREHRSWDAWSASSKTTNARPRGQRWALSNAGDDGSVVLNSLQQSAAEYIRTGEGDEQLGLFEWSAPDGCALDDRDGWAQANPSLGYTVQESSIAADLRTDPPAVFRVECLCQNVPSLDAAVDVAAWTSCADPTGTLDDLRDRVCLCLDISPSLDSVTLAAAALGEDGRTRTELVETWRGPGCVEAARAALPSWQDRIRPRVTGWFPGGPGVAMAADLDGKPKTSALAGLDVLAACQGFAEQTVGRRLLHTADPLLDAQVAGASRLHSGDGWRFTRKGVGNCDALYATAGAVHLARTLPTTSGRVRLVTGTG